MYKRILLTSVLLLVTTLHSASAKLKPYNENLGVHRIHFFSPITKADLFQIQNVKIKKNNFLVTTHDITQQLHNLLADLKSYYAMNEFISGYTIQAYAGGSREQAFKVRNLLYTHYPAWNPEIQYKQPHFTVRVGRFLDRLEAYKWYIPIKNLIPQAIVRPAYFPNEPHLFKIDAQHIEPGDTIQSARTQEIFPND
jgi:hypothetical protein